MKLLILSDSHGNVDTMCLAAEREHPDGIIHLGDYWRDAAALKELLPDIPVYQVQGNCDSYSWAPGRDNILIRKFEDVVFYMAHGHQHGVKMTYLRLHLAAKEAGARVALFGHTHCSLLEEVDGTLLMNPGSCGSSTGTYGVIEVFGEEVHGEIRKLPVGA